MDTRRRWIIGTVIGAVALVLLVVVVVALAILYELKACYEKSDASVQTKGLLGNECGHVTGNACKDLNAECRENENGTLLCMCLDSFYDNNGPASEGKCVEKQSLGGKCDPNGSLQCADKNAECDFNTTKCQCVKHYFDADDDDNNTVGLCIPEDSVKCYTCSDSLCGNKKYWRTQWCSGSCIKESNGVRHCSDSDAKVNYCDSTSCSCTGHYCNAGFAVRTYLIISLLPVIAVLMCT